MKNEWGRKAASEKPVVIRILVLTVNWLEQFWCRCRCEGRGGDDEAARSGRA